MNSASTPLSPLALQDHLKKAAKKTTGISHSALRWMRISDETVNVTRGIVEPSESSVDQGYMVSVFRNGGLGYSASSDASAAGIDAAFAKACAWADASSGKTVTDFDKVAMPNPVGTYRNPSRQPWNSMPLPEKITRLQDLAKTLKISDDIVDWRVNLFRRQVNSIYVTLEGGKMEHDYDVVFPGITVRANNGKETQTRTLAGYGLARQGGLEVLSDVGFFARGREIAEEARQLLSAPNCPSGVRDALIMPDQMILQIHESIGHPLELDRILGDERNYAGTSFVTLDMIGKYQYGSRLLNITFDPTVENEVASYHADDDGTAASKQFIIRGGILERVIGGTISQHRAPGISGVASSRATSWNRPPIDRMSNLNLECGTSSLEQMISGTEKGIVLKTNCSWSIDDSRNKFQFGCELGQLIEDGKLTTIVKNPNYRGVSATFWRSLKMVGDPASHLVMGTPNCGKGEPNQAIHVGHASPACLFDGVDIFGGEA